MSDTDTVEILPPQRDAKTGQFLKGYKGGPGRKLGSRHAHGETFLREFARDFAEHGAEVIAKVRIEQPAVYLKIAADLLPKEMALMVGSPSDFMAMDTPAEIIAKIREEMGDKAADLLQMLIDADAGEVIEQRR